MLTYGLWNQGNGTYKLYAFGVDGDGQAATLGTKTITVSNATANKPFGTIDTPRRAAPPPAPCRISAGPDSRSILLHRQSERPGLDRFGRPDARGLWRRALRRRRGVPGYTNAAAAGAHYTLDTTALTDGVHTIGWMVTDNCGRADGIGSRFFTVVNGTAQTTGMSASVKMAAPREFVSRSFSEREWALARMEGPGEAVRAAATGERVIQIAEGERIALQLPGESTYTANGLLIGSSFDAATGKFYWQPAAGFLGKYDLEFTAGTRTERVRAVVGPPIRMVIDTPRAGNVLSASGFTLAGWAVDLASLDGAGIDTLHVWAYPVGGGAPVFVGVARGGGQRPDVATLYGAAFGGAGFTLSGGLPPWHLRLRRLRPQRRIEQFRGG
jgi:hypothetical protein